MTKLVALNQKVTYLQTVSETNWDKIVRDWLDSMPSPLTQKAYRRDLNNFLSDLGLTIGGFISLSKGQAFEYLTEYKGKLLSKALSPATINRRLSSIKSFVSHAYQCGHCEFSLLKGVCGVKSKSYRDTSGVSISQYKEVLGQCDTSTILGKRNYALLYLLWSNALRVGEVVKLSRNDFDVTQSRLRILGKGRRETEWVSISSGTRDALSVYLSVRNDDNDALFISHDPVNWGHRLSVEGITKMVKKYCFAAGITKTMSPHRIRHSAITTALDATNGDVRKVQKLSRHSNLNTLLIYDDNRTNGQGEVSELLSELLD